MTIFSRLFRKNRDRRAAVRPLWQAIVDEGRRPFWYAEGGVQDSVTGRFDAISMVTASVILRMEGRPELRSANALLTECFVEDMEGQLREFGVNDVVVGKRMGKLVGALGGRLGALRTAIPDGQAAVAEVVKRNMALEDDAKPECVADALIELGKRLQMLDDEALLSGKIAPEYAE